MNFSVAPGLDKNSNNPFLLAGPCVVEGEKITMQIAEKMKEITTRLGIPYVFKASFDKANRTSAGSFRSQGIESSLEILKNIKKDLNIPIVTDVHESAQVDKVAEIVDVLQIPAFLCRQTDLLQAAGNSGLTVNIKKGQFMAPEDMQYAVEKVKVTGNDKVLLTERGSSFGYHNLVVDMRALVIMRQYAPVVFDMTHSVQMPGGAGGSTSGKREFAPVLARAAAAVGVDGFFIETHPDPDKALSDGPNMIRLENIEEVLTTLLEINKVVK